MFSRSPNCCKGEYEIWLPTLHPILDISKFERCVSYYLVSAPDRLTNRGSIFAIWGRELDSVEVTPEMIVLPLKPAAYSLSTYK